MSSPTALQISPAGAGAALTPHQKRFNTLIRQIGQARETLAAWGEGIVAYRQSHAEVLKPLQAELAALQRQFAFALDAALEQPHWTDEERELLEDVLCAAAGELLDMQEDPELKALFNKHAAMDYDTEQRESVLHMKAMAEAAMGLDLGDDDDIASEDDLFQRMQQGMRELEAEKEARSAKAARRRKTAAQQRREAEEQQATQSVREIYRKLASSLHPDRETDPQQREEKTALMQQVNQAYAANDLLALLELQLRIEQIDAAHIAAASAESLKRYNKVLAEQLAELKAEIERVELDFSVEFGAPMDQQLNPRKLGALLERAGREMRAARSERQQEIRMLGNVAATRRWVKRRLKALRESDFDFGLF